MNRLFHKNLLSIYELSISYKSIVHFMTRLFCKNLFPILWIVFLIKIYCLFRKYLSLIL